MMDAKIICTNCGGEKFKVINKRNIDHMIWRRRECKTCKFRFTTFEFMVTKDKKAIKVLERFENFERELQELKQEIAKENHSKFYADIKEKMRNGQDYLE
jgi:transcriptional regulator NrdR family protein